MSVVYFLHLKSGALYSGCSTDLEHMKEQLTFFTQVLGFPLVGLFEMHGVPGGKHAFLKMADDSFFSVVELDGVGDIPAKIGVTHAGTGAGKCAAGTMQHIAFRAPDEAGLLALRNRIRSHGVPADRKSVV